MATCSDIREYSANQLSDFLKVKGIGEDTLTTLRENRVGGDCFLDLTESDLRELITPFGERKALQKLINAYKPVEVVSTATLAKQTGSETVSSNWAKNFEIPHQFSRKTMHAIETGQITRCCRVEIITALAFQIYTKHTCYPTSEEYTAVCRNLVLKYPVLKDTIGNGIGSWKLQLRMKMKNMRRDPTPKRTRDESGEKENEDPTGNPAKKPTTQSQRAGSSLREDVADNIEYESNIQGLSDELAKQKPSRKTVRKLMKETFAGRRRWVLADSPSVVEVVKVFPPIKQVKYLHRELQAVADSEIEFDLDSANAAWQALESKIQQLAVLEARNSSKLRELMSFQKSPCWKYST